VIPELDNPWEIYYICRDYLGSITHVVKADGSLKQELSYDAWGRLRNPANQVAYFPSPQGEGSGVSTLFLGRGYTGHEHLQQFGLINMNARLYDPALGRFLSPDPYVQAPDFTQNFNRYSYALNNPLKYVDQNGEFIITAIVIGGAILGAYLGGASGNHGELNPTKWDFSSPDTYVGMLTGAAIGAVAGYGIAVPGSVTFSFGLFANNSLGSIALSLGGIAVGGSMSDWNFQWSTSAGGGGQYNFPDKNSSNKSNGSNHITNHNEQRNFERNYNSYLDQQLYNFRVRVLMLTLRL